MPHPSSYVQTTHAVTNQPKPLDDYDAYALDPPLVECAARSGAAWLADKLSTYGKLVGSAETAELGRLANRYVPELRAFDRWGHRVDEVDYHPAYHELMRRAMAHEVHNVSWRRPGPGAHLAHATLLYLHAQAEAGSCC